GRVGRAVDGALSLVQHQAGARGVELYDVVSGYAAEVPYWGDEERVRQILVNLLSNAVKFTGPGGRITVSAGTAATPPAGASLEGPGPWAYVRVEDTGQGIPPERLAAVFEPFVQADMTHTRQHGGTGLGLAISRRLARLMGGDLTARSEVGAGSSFFLWLPAATEETIASTPVGEGERVAPVPGILHDVRDALLAEMERVLYSFLARLRSDPAVPSAHAVGEAELEDHLASFLSDLAHTLGGLDLAAGPGSGALRDGTAIQRTISERHGRQRFRLGWSEDELRREHTVLREELAAVVRRRVHREREAEVEEAIGALADFLGSAERISLESWREAAAGG
ncbi:MAG TPA: ATP-binding protein, partial [Longimicrobiaceae bacterium]